MLLTTAGADETGLSGLPCFEQELPGLAHSMCEQSRDHWSVIVEVISTQLLFHQRYQRGPSLLITG
jgi:hypothetical protein